MRERLFSIFDTVPVSTVVGTLCVLGLGAVVADLTFDRMRTTQTTVSTVASAGPQMTVEVDTNAVEAPAASPLSETSGVFYVVGSDIVAPDGTVFVPVGVNSAVDIADTAAPFSGGNGGVVGRVDDVKAWGWNTVRINLMCNDTDDVSQSQVVNGISEAVDTLTEAQVVVIVSCHDGAGTNMTINDEIEEELRAFWDIVVERYQDNPYVWFNFFSEPWELRDEQESLDSWFTLQQFYINRYRNQGVENIIIADLPGFAQAIDLVADDSFADSLSTECNVVLGWHAWGDLGGEEATPENYRLKALAARAKKLAIVATEAGIPEPLEAGTVGFPAWNVSGFDAVVELATEESFGLLWWHGTGDTETELFYPLTADGSGFWTAATGSNLSEGGRLFWNFSQAIRPVATFDGLIASSGCRSALN